MIPNLLVLAHAHHLVAFELLHWMMLSVAEMANAIMDGFDQAAII